MGDRPTPNAPQACKSCPSPGALLLPHSAQSQLAAACDVGLVAGPHAHTPRTHSQWVVGPGRTRQRRAARRGRAPNRGHPSPRQETFPPPPGALVPPPQLAKTARMSAHCGVGDGSPRPHPKHPQPVGSGPRPHAPRTGGRAWESAQSWSPHTQARGAPPPQRPRAVSTARKARSKKQACPQEGERRQAR